MVWCSGNAGDFHRPDILPTLDGFWKGWIRGVRLGVRLPFHDRLSFIRGTPAMTNKHQGAITALREHCNKIIKRLNDMPRNVSASTYHERVVDFDMVNGLLKKCDAVFAAEDANKHQGWQPIASCPDGGTAIWVGAACGNHGLWGMEPVRRRKPHHQWSNIYSELYIDFAPTHWQPLPPPPEQGGGL